MNILHDSALFPPYTVKVIFYAIFQALAVYINFSCLIPQYLENSRFREYISYFFIVQISTALFIVAGYYISAMILNLPIENIYGRGTDCFFYFFGEAMPSTLATSTLAMSIKLAVSWIHTERKKQALETEKLESELLFLKNQFNPHFLFNSINSIFFLIHKNPDRAAASLAKFSDLLRHQLYECNDHKIPLKKELLYLQNFIELEKLRQNKNVTVVMETELVDHEALAIAPFILMTFVENAFKHISNHKYNQNQIFIKLKSEDKKLDFFITNTISSEPKHQSGYSGIGLKNVKRRLDLIYPGEYDLQIKQTGRDFQVRLYLLLEDKNDNGTNSKDGFSMQSEATDNW
jgi:two-component system LytT family sensor kinase